MDDIISGNDEEAINELKSHLHDSFHIKDLGKLKYFLGIEVSQSRKDIYISQRKYALDILHEFKQLGSTPSSIPIKHNLTHELFDANPPLHDPSKYRRLIGKLLYLIITKPDIAYSVSYLSQFLAQSLTSHYASNIKILKYIKQASRKGLLYKRNAILQLRVFCDADWADCPTTRKSISGNYALLGDVELKYRSMTSCVCELLWLHYFSHDL